MAGKKAPVERTAKQKVLDAAQIKYDAAREAHEKKPTDQTQKALTDADTARKAALAPVKRENFVRVAGSRVKKINVAIRNLGTVNKLSQYTYSAADIDVAEKSISEKLANAIASMRAGLNTSSAAPKEQEESLFTE